MMARRCWLNPEHDCTRRCKAWKGGTCIILWFLNFLPLLEDIAKHVEIIAERMG